MKLCGIKINKIKYYSLFSAFVYHVPQFLEMHGTLMQFNCQPVENAVPQTVKKTMSLVVSISRKLGRDRHKAEGEWVE